MPVYVYIILRGKMKMLLTMRNGRTLLIGYYASDVILGEIELVLDSDTAASSVQAITEVACIRISRERRREDMKNSIPFMNAVGAELALFCSNRSSVATLLQSMETRLCTYIANTNNNGYEILTDIAEVLGTSYRHLLRTLENLCRYGVLKKRPRNI